MDHRTDQYNINFSVFRRGFPIVIHCPCDDSHRISSLQVGLRAGRAARGISVKEFRVIHGYDVAGWTVRYESSNSRNATIVLLNPPANAIVGHYLANFYVDGKLRKTIKFLLLFNPWCKDENKRREYVMNTHTIIYMGTYRRIIPRGWNLAQFQTASIEALLMILDRMPAEDRVSPIKVSRFLSSIVNANDNNGVVLGNWSGNYQGGMNPNAWNGSGAILAKYAKYRSPVRFGQCWVFCGVLLLRSCGIPSRCVTCYNSFHDHDGSLAWEKVCGKAVFYNRNYHCWNEAWMDRRDLPSGNGGWQIVDSTPQERSQGYYRCGPASRSAVKSGNIDLPFDTGFVFAEVNAEKIFYHQKPGGNFVIGRIDRQIVGRNLSCKAVGSNNREDITYNYKFPDNSDEEKIIHSKVKERKRRVRSPPRSPVRVEMFTPFNCTFKKDYPIHFKFINQSNLISKTKFRILITCISYRGRIVTTLLNEMYQLTINGNSEKQFHEVITANQLCFAISNDSSNIKVEINGLVNDRDFLYTENIYEIDTPKIEIYSGYNNMQRGLKYRTYISITNPLNYSLTNAKLLLSGDILVGGRTKIPIGILPSEEKFESSFEVISRFRGEFYIYATLQSNEISGFERYVSFKFN